MRGLFAQLFTAATLASAASAAPWVRDQAGWHGCALVAHDTLGNANGWRGDLYAQCGLTKDWTVTAKSQSVTYPDYEVFDRDAFRLTLRPKLFTQMNCSAAAESGPIYGSTVAGLYGCEGFGFEARRGLDYSGTNKTGRKFYAFADAAYIREEDGCERVRAESGYGSDLSERVVLTQQLWFEVGNQSASLIKIDNQFGMHFHKVDVSVGEREELGGQFDEHAVFIAVAARRKRYSAGASGAVYPLCTIRYAINASRSSGLRTPEKLIRFPGTKVRGLASHWSSCSGVQVNVSAFSAGE
jgi:hypothetical protein